MDVDEAGAGNLDALDQFTDVERGRDALREFARIAAGALGCPHGAVGLIVAEARLGGGREQCLTVRRQAHRVHGALDRSPEFVSQIHH